jgi:hypothetical protein
LMMACHSGMRRLAQIRKTERGWLISTFRVRSFQWRPGMTRYPAVRPPSTVSAEADA